jgi:hypothetical protein
MDDSSTKPGAPEPGTDSAHGGSSLWFVWAFFLLVVIYPLSIGPAAKIHRKHPAARPAIETAYKPVTTLMEHSTHVRDFFVWYAEKIWKLDSPGPPPPTTQTNSAAAPGK